MLDLGASFSPEADHLGTLLSDRDTRNEGRVPLGIAFLDDCLGGVYPRDLVLLGSATGVGKTALAVQAAMAGAEAGKEVYLFALEAEVGEVGARLYFEELGRRAKEPRLDFAGWWRGQWKGLDAKYRAEVEAALRPRLARLRTFYKKRGDFTPKNLSQQLEAIAERAGMIVLDHVHVIDAESERGELRAQKQTVGLLRDIALDLGVPVVAVSHIRKKDKGAVPTLLPDTDDLHGASDLSKVATQVVLFGREWDGPRPEPHLSPTLMRVSKDRHGRASTMVARMYYRMDQARYENAYELGKLEWKDRRQQWTSLPMHQLPAWAERDARRLEADEGIPF
jgi:replicative DNA helicase